MSNRALPARRPVTAGPFFSPEDAVYAPARGPDRSYATPTSHRPAWEYAVGALLDSEPEEDDTSDGTTPLALQLSVTAAGPRGGTAGPRLAVTARVVQPGRRGGWVGGNLGWDRLGSLQYGSGPRYADAQVAVLEELYAAYTCRERRYYGYGDRKTISFAEFESRQLWPILDQARAAGLRLVHARPGLGEIEPYHRAELVLDITAGPAPGRVRVVPVVRVEDGPDDVVAVDFAGGHGLLYARRDQVEREPDPAGWQLSLARLVRDVPFALRRMALADTDLEVPVSDLARFAQDFYPRLRRLAPVVSSDDSFTPPRLAQPVLVLHARYRPVHQLDLEWEWVYQVDGIDVPGERVYRDRAAERAVLERLELPPSAAEWLGDGPAGEPTSLTGLDTMRFTTQVLPLLSDRPGLDVRVHGDPADYREATDSVRIAVSTSARPGETDWFDLGITVTLEGRPVPFLDVFTALSRDATDLLLADGAYFSLDKPELRALRGLIEESRALDDRPAEQLRVSPFQAGWWEELTRLGVVTEQAQAWRRSVQGLLTSDSAPAAVSGPAPDGVRSTLRGYQLDGLRWLEFLWRHRLGGILADDMGLGKTLQTLALISGARRAEPGLPPFLIVAPTSVVANWAAEAARFVPDLRVAIVSDTLRGRDLPADVDLVVTSYTLLRLDAEEYATADWSGLVLDEAQFAKNHKSKVYQCIRSVRAPFRLAITGTPMENNLMELWSLLSITAPGLFPNATRFRDYYARPVERAGDTERLAQLRRRIRPLVKRRTKEQVAVELPAKQEQTLEVDLHPEHRKLYQMHLQRERQKVLGLLGDFERNRFTVLRSLTLLRQLSLHPALIDEEHASIPSGKLDALSEQLADVVAGGHRALVFSQFTRFLDLVRRRLEDDGLGYQYLDGRTRDRPEVLRAFKDGTDPVFLISLKAGGFGLNLTEADYCFLLDPWWNPATEAQAVDRTHRIGQTRNVMVYRLIAADTIEEKVMALKSRKAALFTSVMDDGDTFSTALTPDDIRTLLT